MGKALADYGVALRDRARFELHNLEGGGRG
jgi:hypothetical protein